MKTLDGPWLDDDEGRAGEQPRLVGGDEHPPLPFAGKLASIAEAGSDAPSTPTDGRGSRGLRQTLVAVDLAAGLLAGGAIAVFSIGGLAARQLTPRLFVELLVPAVAVGANAIQGLYRARVCAVKAQERVGIARTALVAGIGARLLGNVLHASVTVGVAVVAGLILLIAMTGGRAMFSAWLRVCRSSGRFTRDVVLIGVNEEAVELISLIEGRPELGYRVRGLIGDRALATRIGCGDVPVLGGLDEATEAVARSGASGAIVLASALDPSRTNEIVRSLLDNGVHVQLGSGLSRCGHRRLRAQPLSHETLFYVERVSFSRAKVLSKRALDVVLSGVLIIVTAPLMVAASLAVKLGDRGPVLFRQERTGQGGKSFTLYKLRTMVPDASSRLNELIGSNERQGPLFKLTIDPRVTRVGRFLRSTSIDELPQLFNVFAGTMSLVGPRPALDHEVADFDDELTAAKMAVPPGITGLWQVEARDNPSFGAYRNLDLFYIENWSVSLDLAILAATAPVVISRGLRPLVRRLSRSQQVIDLSDDAQLDEEVAALGHAAPSGISLEPVVDLRDQAPSVVGHTLAGQATPETGHGDTTCEDMTVAAGGSAA